MKEPVANNPLAKQRAKQDTQWPKDRTRRFIWAKLVLGMISIIIAVSNFWDQPTLFLKFVAVILADLAFLILYYRLAQFGPNTRTLATYLSTTINVIVLTWILHFTLNFTFATVLVYILLPPMTYLAIPESRTTRLVTLMTSVAYLILVFLEISGIAPLVNDQKYQDLQPWIGFAMMMLLTFWGAANRTEKVIATYDKQQQENAELRIIERQQKEAEDVWRTVGKSVISTQDLDQVLSRVIQAINEKMRVETGSVILRDEITGELAFAKIIRGNIEELSSIRLNEGQGIVGWVISTGQSVIVPDVANDPRWFPTIDHQTGFMTHSILCVPLISNDVTLGAIELLNKQGGSFTQTDLQLLESISGPVAVGIQNAQLHKRVLDQLSEQTRLFLQVEHIKKEWETTVDAIEEGILLVDDRGYLLRTNRTFAGWLQTTPTTLIGKSCNQVIYEADAPPDEYPDFLSGTTWNNAQAIEMKIPRLGGIFLCNTYPLHEQDGTAIGAVIALKNITHEKQVQDQLIQSEKLAAVGRMAASLAHEINNPLQAIQGCLDLAVANPNDALKQQRYLTMAKSELDRLTTMTQRMLDFYRPSKGLRASVNMHQLLEEVLALSAKRLQHTKVTVSKEWDPHTPPAFGIPNQLKQVMLNLVLNAADAMPSGGELKLCGSVVEKDGLWLTVDFIDHGVGIAPKDLDRIFEPFYTTKANGTGLGLGISQNILTSHGGRLTVASTVGKGTRFTMWLPLQPNSNLSNQPVHTTIEDSHGTH